jgi:catalase
MPGGAPAAELSCSPPTRVPAAAAKASVPGGYADPRVVLLLTEAFRHAKAIGAWGFGTDALDAAAGFSIRCLSESFVSENDRTGRSQ